MIIKLSCVIMRLELMCLLFHCVLSNDIRYDNYCEDDINHPFCHNDCLRYPQFDDTDQEFLSADLIVIKLSHFSDGYTIFQ